MCVFIYMYKSKQRSYRIRVEEYLEDVLLDCCLQ